MSNEKNERNWYDPMPAIGVEYNENESKDGAISETVWEGKKEDLAQKDEDVVEAKAAEVEKAEPKNDVSDLTAHEIDEKVESGELTAAQVYEAELAGKKRKTVLAKYGPDDQKDEVTTADAE